MLLAVLITSASVIGSDSPYLSGHPDVHHDMTKTRLSKDGKVVEAPKGKDLTGDVERIASQKAEGYCESRSVVPC